MDTARTLLERYVQAKDGVRPDLMRAIYRPDAVLSYTIDTPDIAFPARTVGLDAITRTLVTDFALRFSACKTYYVCVAPPPDTAMQVRIPWLVVMREPAAGSLRIGKGFYEWTLRADPEQGARVETMHIHIQRMDARPDAGAELLTAAQAQLSYPWLTLVELRTTYMARASESAALAFLREFAEPMSIE